MVSSFLVAVFQNTLTLVKAPFQDISLVWQLAPIFLVWVIMVFYFGTHKKEKLGWNTALGNGISLFWIIISALQHIFANGSLEFTYTKFFLILVIALYSVFIIYISFKHNFSDGFTYALASPTPVYYFSAIVLLYAHNLILLTFPMLVAILLFFIFVLLLIRIIKAFLPEMKEDESDDDLGSFDSKDDSFKDLSNDFSSKNSSSDDFKFDDNSQDPSSTNLNSDSNLDNSFSDKDLDIDFDKDFKF